MTASKGALHVPAEEMVEILVYLAEHNKIMGGQARLTLAAWGEASAKTIAANPTTPKEVLDYWISPKNLRPPVFPLLIENASVTVGNLSELATIRKGEWIDVMISSPRVRGSQQLLADLSSNKELTEVQTVRVQELITGKPAVAVAEPGLAAQVSAVPQTDPGTPTSSPETVTVAAVSATQAAARRVEPAALSIGTDAHPASPEA